ncbi:MAG: arginine--tRNA ligase [Candidatus Spechtbacterales bacterium]|nr:arginine--tRNA ligase [Candidatus Spechtbacterales bacterium]
MLRKTVRRYTKKAIKELQKKGKLPGDIKLSGIKVETPTRAGQGDYSVTIAMQIASQTGRKPKTLAKIIRDELLENSAATKNFSDINVASPGFINFFISDKKARSLLWKIFSDEDFGKVNVGKDKKLNIEFGSINPTGQLHVGHARTFFYSDILANILEFAGYKVTREYYVNNARQSAQIKELGKTVLGNGTSYKGPYLEKKIKKYKKSIKRYKNYGPAGHFMAGKIQKDIETFLAKKAGVEFDKWFEEEELYKKGDVSATMRELKKKGLVYEKDGAIWLKTTKYGDKQDQVLVRSSGENTYFMTDIAYHRNKAKRNFDRLIDVWGADHHGHLRRMQAAMRIFNIKNIDILIAQFVRLKGGAKLSKRRGNIVTVEDLIDEVGLDAARYFFLTKSLDSQMEFDLNLAKQQSQKNPVYYIQYTHARTCSILKKATTDRDFKKTEITRKDLKAIEGEGEFKLINKLILFPEIIEDAARDWQAHRLATYLHELAQEFNQFYRDYRVIDKDGFVSKPRLALTIATGMVINKGLELLGIKAPKKM